MLCSTVCVCVDCRWSLSRHSHPGLRERIPRKGLEALQQTKRTDAINKALLEGKESQNRRATVACIILFCTALGRSIIFFVKYFDERPPCPMLVSSLENRVGTTLLEMKSQMKGGGVQVWAAMSSPRAVCVHPRHTHSHFVNIHRLLETPTSVL